MLLEAVHQKHYQLVNQVLMVYACYGFTINKFNKYQLFSGTC